MFGFFGSWGGRGHGSCVLEQISPKSVDMDELQLAVPEAKNLTR